MKYNNKEESISHRKPNKGQLCERMCATSTVFQSVL